VWWYAGVDGHEAHAPQMSSVWQYQVPQHMILADAPVADAPVLALFGILPQQLARGGLVWLPTAVKSSKHHDRFTSRISCSISFVVNPRSLSADRLFLASE
jgi:hypothetical protein